MCNKVPWSWGAARGAGDMALRQRAPRRLCMAAGLAALVLQGAPAVAEEACDLSPGPSVGIDGVIDGATVALADDGALRLVGVLAPSARPPWGPAEPWPPARAAVEGLRSLLAESRVGELRFPGPRRDRHDRWLAHLYLERDDETVWVQGRLVEQGLVRASALAEHRGCARALQALEARARARALGLWRWGVYAIVSASQTSALLDRVNSFQIVEGRVRVVTPARRWTFVNFEEDWRNDFTVAIAAGDRRRFKGSDVDLAAIEGRRVRVRGWIESWNGPVIKATHPEQIEVLPD